MTLYFFTLNSAYKSLSGGDTCIQNIARIIASKNLDDDVVLSTTEHRIRLHKENNENLSIKYLSISEDEPNTHPVIYYFKNAFKAYFRTKKYLKDYKKDNPQAKIVMLSGSEYFPDTVPSFLFKISGLVDKWIVFSHLIMLTPFQRYEDVYLGKKHGFNLTMAFNWLNQRLSIWLYRFVKQNKVYFAFNSEIEDFLKTRHIKPSSIRYGSQKLDLDQSLKTQHRYDAVFLGRFHAQKGIDYIVPFVSELKKDFPDFKLLVIGGGDQDMRAKLDAEIKSNNMEKNIICVGQKSGQEKDDLIRQSKIFFFPSTYESFGIVVVEATAFKIPTVAFNLPIFPDLFGDTILTAPLGDAIGLAKQAKILLESP